MYKRQTVTVDKMEVPIEGERNLLELVRKARIDLPTFCYHSDISVYGACRMCMVEVDGNGVIPACSTPPADGMVVKTNTKQLRDMRRMIIELMLANHDQNCTTCPKSGDCKLQKISRQMGIDKVRFQQVNFDRILDLSSDAIVRDPSKCVLCGDCVRVCDEIQSVGVLDFANRGAESEVMPCFNKGLGEVECVNCGQCIKVCPVGALIPKSQINEVWDALHDEEKHVVVQIAPAVRVALGEYFGYKPGTTTTGQIVTALRLMGFDQVFDTAFTADLTVIEEGNEFLARAAKGENLPQFTSCCPAWVKFAEQYYQDMLPNLSSCRSPQQMFGSVVKDHLTEELEIPRDKLVVVSIMPCTAKKFEANRPEFSVDGNKDVDYVLTTQELSLMIRERGLTFNNLEPGSFDMPYGFKTGAGVIFGNSGGVSEAVLRYAADALSKGKGMQTGFTEISTGGVKTLSVRLGDKDLKLAVVSGLASARTLIDKIRRGEEYYDLVEVMACCGGCVNGGGQPVTEEKAAVEGRARELLDNDKMLQFHSAHENPYIKEMYETRLTSEKAHELLHTEYSNRKRINSEDVSLSETEGEKDLNLNICFGTSCFLRGAQQLYTDLIDYIREEDMEADTEFKASFCTERCKKGPVLKVNGKAIEQCTFEKAVEEIKKAVQ